MKLNTKYMLSFGRWRVIWVIQLHCLIVSLLCRHESEFIKDIVDEILHKLSYTLQRDTSDLVGIDSWVEELMKLLAIGSNDVHIIGVWGIGGIGKTTLARVVCHMIFNDFEGGSFTTNVRLNLINHLISFIPCQICLYFSI